MGIDLMRSDPTFWRGKRVLVTGHTGFKGSWLCLWLSSLGAEVEGYALAPSTTPSLFEAARVGATMHSTIADVRDAGALRECVARCRPEVVFHLAAQPLVRASYADPVATYGINVMGTVHLLDAVRQVAGVRAVVNVTTDKCYDNREWEWGYREGEPLGGHDPYSSSKACSELVTSAWRRSFCADGSVGLASARAGNVIGGGDWAPDRLVPDVLRAFAQGAPALIRSPDAVRPWQHVLEPLSGYLMLAEALSGDTTAYADAWNFGPRDDDARPVRRIVQTLADAWPSGARWQLDGGPHPHEARQLKLDISKARERLGWAPRWTLETALERIVAWHRQWLDGGDARQLCLDEIASFTGSASTQQAGRVEAGSTFLGETRQP